MPFEAAVVKSQAKDGRCDLPNSNDLVCYKPLSDAAIMDDSHSYARKPAAVK